jgi:hypothetical protein
MITDWSGGGPCVSLHEKGRFGDWLKLRTTLVSPYAPARPNAPWTTSCSTGAPGTACTPPASSLAISPVTFDPLLPAQVQRLQKVAEPDAGNGPFGARTTTAAR